MKKREKWRNDFKFISESQPRTGHLCLVLKVTRFTFKVILSTIWFIFAVSQLKSDKVVKFLDSWAPFTPFDASDHKSSHYILYAWNELKSIFLFSYLTVFRCTRSFTVHTFMLTEINTWFFWFYLSVLLPHLGCFSLRCDWDTLWILRTVHVSVPFRDRTRQQQMFCGFRWKVSKCETCSYRILSISGAVHNAPLLLLCLWSWFTMASSFRT